MQRWMLFAAVAVAVVLAASACDRAPSAPAAVPEETEECTPETVEAFLDDLERLLGRWDDRTAVARNTARVNLAPIMIGLQDLKRDVEELDAPQCAEETQQKAFTYMEQFVDAYLAFMGDMPEATIEEKFERADSLLDDFIAARSELAQRYLSGN